MNLLRMAAVKAIKRALTWEQKTAERQADADHAATYGTAAPTSTATTEEDDNMEEMVGGNKTVNHFYPPPKESEKSSGIGTVGAIAAGAAMLAAGAGVGYMANEALTDKPAVSADTDTDTITDLDFID